MEWLESLRRKADVEGNTIQNSYKNQMENFIDTAFVDSPTYLIVDIDGEDYDARLITEKKFSASSTYETKKLQLRPHIKVDAGKIAKFNDQNWLIVFFEERELEPKAHIRFCNNHLDMENGKSYPCVIDSRTSQAQKIVEERFVDLSPNTLRITVGYNQDTKSIEENDRFVINETAWEVQGVDRYSNVYENVGTVSISVKKVALREDELPEPEEDIIPEDVYAKIIGDDEISINETKQYVFELYVDGELSQDRIEGVSWSVDSGNIDINGMLTAPNETGVINMVVECHYFDSQYNIHTVESNMSIEVFNPYDWGWG